MIPPVCHCLLHKCIEGSLYPVKLYPGPGKKWEKATFPCLFPPVFLAARLDFPLLAWLICVWRLLLFTLCALFVWASSSPCPQLPAIFLGPMKHTGVQQLPGYWAPTSFAFLCSTRGSSFPCKPESSPGFSIWGHGVPKWFTRKVRYKLHPCSFAHIF